jgi:transposase
MAARTSGAVLNTMLSYSHRVTWKPMAKTMMIVMIVMANGSADLTDPDKRYQLTRDCERPLQLCWRSLCHSWCSPLVFIWHRQQGDGWDLKAVERARGTRGLSVQPWRWVVERDLAWLSRNRRLAKDYERKVQTSETLIEVAAIRLLLRRNAGQGARRASGTP